MTNVPSVWRHEKPTWIEIVCQYRDEKRDGLPVCAHEKPVLGQGHLLVSAIRTKKKVTSHEKNRFSTRSHTSGMSENVTSHAKGTRDKWLNSKFGKIRMRFVHVELFRSKKKKQKKAQILANSPIWKNI